MQNKEKLFLKPFMSSTEQLEKMQATLEKIEQRLDCLEKIERHLRNCAIATYEIERRGDQDRDFRRQLPTEHEYEFEGLPARRRRERVE